MSNDTIIGIVIGSIFGIAGIVITMIVGFAGLNKNVQDKLDSMGENLNSVLSQNAAIQKALSILSEHAFGLVSQALTTVAEKNSSIIIEEAANTAYKRTADELAQVIVDMGSQQRDVNQLKVQFANLMRSTATQAATAAMEGTISAFSGVYNQPSGGLPGSQQASPLPQWSTPGAANYLVQAPKPNGKPYSHIDDLTIPADPKRPGQLGRFSTARKIDLTKRSGGPPELE